MFLRFEMSGQRFEFDLAPEKFTYDDLFVIEDLFAMTMDVFLKRLQAPGGPDSSMKLRAMGIVAYLCHRRGGGDMDWPAFSRTIAPATLRMVPAEPPPAPAPAASPTAATLAAGASIFDVPENATS